MASSPVIHRALVALVSASFALPAGAVPSFHVVLSSGTRLVATSRPLVAMGRVSFLDESRRPVTLPASAVDIDATRAATEGRTAGGPVWDAKKLQALKAADRGVQFYGADASGDGATQDAPDSVDSSAPAGDGDAQRGTPAERLRTEIEGLNARIRSLPTADRERSLLVIRQLELQEELSRLLGGPRRG